MFITEEQIKEIARLTTGQRDNPLWHQYRKNRITGSLFGKALRTARNIKRRNEPQLARHLTNDIFQEKTYGHFPAIQWGIDNEKNALERYEAETGYKVIETGLWLFPDGNLAASPDGLVADRKDPTVHIGIVEVKCPYRLKNEKPNEVRPWYYQLEYLDQNNKLRKSHDYYHQIQAQLVATKMDWCDFVVSSPYNLLIQRIYIDQQWKDQELVEISEFYLTYVSRDEDRKMHNWNGPPLDAPKMELEKILNCEKCGDNNEGSYRPAAYYLLVALACHLGRWVYHFQTLKPANLSWSKLVEKHFEEAKKNICKVCLVKLYNLKWQKSTFSEIHQGVFKLLKERDWNIPEEILQQAYDSYLSKMKLDSELRIHPCACVKF